MFPIRLKRHKNTKLECVAGITYKVWIKTASGERPMDPITIGPDAWLAIFK